MREGLKGGEDEPVVYYCITSSSRRCPKDVAVSVLQLQLLDISSVPYCSGGASRLSADQPVDYDGRLYVTQEPLDLSATTPSPQGHGITKAAQTVTHFIIHIPCTTAEK